MYHLGLIGFPIQQSLSPWIHDKYLSIAKLTGNYKLMEIDLNESFDERMLHLKDEEIHGFNITVPYKEKIIPYLDDIDEEAKKMGAVNTVVNKNGKWIGYNTDGIGYLRSLIDAYPELLSDLSKRILIVGAGGAARGIYYALAVKGFEMIDITNRTRESAEDIAKLGEGLTATTVLSLEEAEEEIAQYDVIIQTTSVGMGSGNNQSIISLKGLKPSAIVSDIIYQPIETAFLKQAKAIGASIHYGHTMLLYQAQYAFEIWTGKRVSIGQLDDELKNVLEGR